jgi:hypothetical protein
MKKISLFLLLCLPSIGAAQEKAIKVTTTLHDDGTRTDMKVDPASQTAEATTYAGEKILRRVAYKLDASGQMQEGDVFGPDGKMLFHAVFRRDALNRVVEEFNYAADGRLIRRLVYEYNTSGKIAKIDAFDAAGNPLSGSRGVADKRKRLPRRNR